MKRSLFLILALMVSLSSWCQDVNRVDTKGRRQGAWTDFYPNGQKLYVVDDTRGNLDFHWSRLVFAVAVVDVCRCC